MKQVFEENLISYNIYLIFIFFIFIGVFISPFALEESISVRISFWMFIDFQGLMSEDSDKIQLYK